MKKFGIWKAHLNDGWLCDDKHNVYAFDNHALAIIQAKCFEDRDKFIKHDDDYTVGKYYDAREFGKG